MFDPDQLSKLEIVGERKYDDLPCAKCDKIGPILIVNCLHCGRTYDVCRECIPWLFISWRKIES
jgi:hypothetical protein